MKNSGGLCVKNEKNTSFRDKSLTHANTTTTMTMTIQEATQQFLDHHHIKTRADLEKFLGKTRTIMYKYVSQIAKEHWGKVKVPRSHVRAYYEIKLFGYKCYKG